MYSFSPQRLDQKNPFKIFDKSNSSVPAILSDYFRRLVSFIRLFTHLNLKVETRFFPETFSLMSKNDERTLLPRLFPSPTHVVAVSSLWSECIPRESPGATALGETRNS